ALGIGLFILVLAILLAFSCWYYKRRSGYKSLRVSSKSSNVSTIRNMVGGGEILDCKTALQDYRDFPSVVPDAPPAYDKIAADQLPPPYSP
ncbi:MAR1 protein, partial [Acrocephalus arundinaceus]|nr:MAR1 protein [Acrocephalus arundinaceus]